MVRDGGAATVSMSILHVRSSLPDESEPEPLQNAAYLARPQDWKLAHELSNLDLLSPDKLAL